MARNAWRPVGWLCSGLILGLCAGCASLWTDAPAETAPRSAVSSPSSVDSDPDKQASSTIQTVGAKEQKKETSPDAGAAAFTKRDALPIDLPGALSLADSANPTINLARERVREAYFALDAAEVAWLPNLQTGPAYLRHDGQTQSSHGDIFGVSKQSFFEGGGAVLSWDSSSLIFGQLIARRLAEAQAASSRTVSDKVQLEVALTYLDLVRVYAQIAINADTLARAEEMMRSAEAGEEAGKGKTPADLPRARAEVQLRREERIDLNGQAAVISAHLARLLLLEPTVDLRPAEATVVPISLVPTNVSLDQLVATGFGNRPELAESRSLVQAAQARYRQAQLDPLIPKLEVSYFGGTFGGGINGDMSHFSGRSDGVAQAVWELRNLGAGNVAQTRVRRSQFDQANTHVAEIQAQVGEEVTAAAKVVRTRQEALESAQKAVKQALETWRRLSESSFGLGGRDKRYDPLEPLLAEQSLDQARLRYLEQVIEYNKSQFRLYWAMGQPPLEALPNASARPPVEVPVVPAKYTPPGTPAKP